MNSEIGTDTCPQRRGLRWHHIMKRQHSGPWSWRQFSLAHGQALLPADCTTFWLDLPCFTFKMGSVGSTTCSSRLEVCLHASSIPVTWERSVLSSVFLYLELVKKKRIAYYCPVKERRVDFEVPDVSLYSFNFIQLAKIYQMPTLAPCNG